MIPNHLALVPISPFQLAAIQAIACVEAKQDCSGQVKLATVL